MPMGSLVSGTLSERPNILFAESTKKPAYLNASKQPYIKENRNRKP